MAESLENCNRIFVELEAQRTAIIADLESWSPDQLCVRLAPASWSAVEVLDHLVRAETGTVADLQAGLRNPQKLCGKDRPGIAALDRALRSQQKFQVPASAASIHPDKNTTLPEVSGRWEHTRKDLGRVLMEAPADAACQGVFHHPFAGWMTLEEVLKHLAAHLFHHQFQLARLQADSAHFQAC